MGECREYGQEAKYDRCLKFYNDQKNGQSVVPASVEPSGLSDKELDYRQNMIKARIAETLVEELFLSIEWASLDMAWKIPFPV